MDPCTWTCQCWPTGRIYLHQFRADIGCGLEEMREWLRIGMDRQRERETERVSEKSVLPAWLDDLYIYIYILLLLYHFIQISNKVFRILVYLLSCGHRNLLQNKWQQFSSNLQDSSQYSHPYIIIIIIIIICIVSSSHQRKLVFFQCSLSDSNSSFSVDYHWVWSSGWDKMIRLHLKIRENTVRLTFLDGFWVAQIPFLRMVKLNFLAQFLVDHPPHPVMSSLIPFLSTFNVFAYYIIDRFVSITT